MNATPLIHRLLPLATCLLLATGARAQTPQPPLTGQMLAGPAQTAPSPQEAEVLPRVDVVPAAASAAPREPSRVAAAPPAPLPPPRTEVGDSTRYLLRLQASGQQAGPRLPILGDQATASYARYLKSFQYDIPQFFDTDVGKPMNSSRTGR